MFTLAPLAALSTDTHSHKEGSRAGVFCGLGSATGNSRSGPRVGLILLLLITTCYTVSAGGGDLDLAMPSRDGKSMWADSTEKKDPSGTAVLVSYQRVY